MHADQIVIVSMALVTALICLTLFEMSNGGMTRILAGI
jgi:hypothetical protein